MTSNAEPDAQEEPTPGATKKTRRWIVVGVAVAIALLYFAQGQFVAYTEDGYVRSDFVEVAPEVDGVVVAVDVANDQKIAAGAPLAAIDAQPFQLAAELTQKRIDAALFAAKAKQEKARTLAADLDAAQAAIALAQKDFNRSTALAREKIVAQASLDRAVTARQKALDAVAEIEARQRVNDGEVAAALAAADIASAELALDHYRLSKTRLTAPVSGFVTNLTLRPGAYAKTGVPLIGIVDDARWRVVANYKEYVASRLKPGMRAWIWLDSHPWRLFPARVAGIGRGISRNPEPGRMLPYIAPTTDWIRLARRIPVTLAFDPAPDVQLFMGADARILIFP